MSRFDPEAYDVEIRVFSGHFKAQWRRPDGMAIADQRALIERLAEHFNYGEVNVVRHRSRYLDTYSNAWPKTRTIRMGALAGPAVCCHEFAHLLAGGPDWHGERWQHAYVACVRVGISDFHADRLGIAFDIMRARQAENRSRGARKAAATRKARS